MKAEVYGVSTKQGWTTASVRTIKGYKDVTFFLNYSSLPLKSPGFKSKTSSRAGK